MGVGGQPQSPAASTPRKGPVPIVQEAGWAPGPIWMVGKSRPRRDSIPDLPALSSVAIPTELPGPKSSITKTGLLNKNLPFIDSVRFVCRLILLTFCVVIFKCAGPSGRAV
jgi:hypothetical protein